MAAALRRPPLFFLVLFSAVSPLATDMYLAAFPQMAQELGTSEIRIQLSFSAFIAGLALGQLVIGPVSDGVGRRRPLLLGVVVFVLASLACAFVTDAEVLAALRFVQGFSGAAGVVVSRAVVTDLMPPPLAARTFATVAVFHTLAPVIAPAIGGVLIVTWGWRSVFYALTVLGLLMLVGAQATVPESLPPDARHGTTVRATVSRIVTLLRHRPFVRYVYLACLTCGGFFISIAGSSVVFHDTFGVQEGQYTVFFTVNALGMASAMAVSRLLLGRVEPDAILRTGLWLSVCGASLAVALALAGVATFASTWLAIFIVTAGMGCVFPMLIVRSQAAGARFPGTAAALLGGLQFLAGAMTSPLTGMFDTSTILPMTASMLLLLVGAVVVFYVTGRSATTPKELA